MSLNVLAADSSFVHSPLRTKNLPLAASYNRCFNVLPFAIRVILYGVSKQSSNGTIPTLLAFKIFKKVYGSVQEFGMNDALSGSAA